MGKEPKMKERIHRKMRWKNGSRVQLRGVTKLQGMIGRVLKTHVNMVMVRRSHNGPMRVTGPHVLPRGQPYPHIIKGMIPRSLQRRIRWTRSIR